MTGVHDVRCKLVLGCSVVCFLGTVLYLMACDDLGRHVQERPQEQTPSAVSRARYRSLSEWFRNADGNEAFVCLPVCLKLGHKLLCLSL